MAHKEQVAPAKVKESKKTSGMRFAAAAVLEAAAELKCI
jgi:hypothetical protein